MGSGSNISIISAGYRPPLFDVAAPAAKACDVHLSVPALFIPPKLNAAALGSEAYSSSYVGQELAKTITPVGCPPYPVNALAPVPVVICIVLRTGWLSANFTAK